MRILLWVIPAFLMLECALRPISEPDIFMYFALVERFLKTGSWPLNDPFVYTIASDRLMTLHQWLGYFLYYSLYPWLGWAGPILLMTFFIVLLIALPLAPFWRARRVPPVWFPLLWTVAIFGAHHRFRERVSLFGDLLGVVLVGGLYWCSERRWFWYLLPGLFLLWAQLHPSYPLGWAILLVWAVTHRSRVRWGWIGLCFLAPFLNPMGWQGVLYPFEFSHSIEPYLRKYVVEWLPLTDPRLYEFRFLYLPFVTLIPYALAMLIWQRRRADLFDWFIVLLSTALLVKSVRFGLLAHGLLLILFTSLELRRTPVVLSPARLWAAGALTAILSCGVVLLKEGLNPAALLPLNSRFEIDRSYFPEDAVDRLNKNKPHMKIFHSFGYGGYLAYRWQGDPPIFFHGFSTNFKFYEENYYFPQESRDKLDQLIAKWDIGVFLLSKLGNDNNFIQILVRHPEWQAVYQDRACVIFVKRDPRVFGGS